MTSNSLGMLLLPALFLQLLFSPSHSQQTGAYPSVSSVATYRPVTADSVCGADGPEQYCQYTNDATPYPSLGLLPTCIAATCDNTCPHAATSPDGFDLASAGSLGPGVTPAQGREGGGNMALRFQSSFVEVPASNVPALSELGFTFAAWINRDPSSNSRGTLVSKSSPDADSIERNYVVSVEEDRVIFDYLPDTVDFSGLPEGSQRYRTVIIDGVSLAVGVWHHIAVTVYAEDAAVYVNGTVEGVQALEGKMVDTNRTLLLGETSDGIGSYQGLMEGVYLYSQALTQREVQELFEGSLPFSYLSTECHCPPSHPVIDLDDETRCIQHSGGNLISRGASHRIDPLAHPPGFINDLNVGEGNGWISFPGDRQVNITLNLTNSLYELIFVNFRFGSPRFKAAILETSRDSGATFEPIQYFADDCMAYFGLPNDGAITEADSVNCITSQSLQTPTQGADVRTRLLDPQLRPFDLNSSPELREFILSSHLQLRLIDLFTEDTSEEHQYYNILEITVAARCACNGHSSRCGSSIDSVCECAHNTEGDTCDHCLPLYNEKPWRYGETDNAYPCKTCDCNGHTTTCHYNTTLDPFPGSYDQGGGGVCDDCQSNTAGQHCENCAFAYYRQSGVSANDSNPCTPCDCDTRGDTNNGDCVKSEGISGQIVGQCQCKTNVVGLQCDECRDGFFALSASNPQGCSPCNCDTDGTVEASVTCHATSGQCQCKENVMGLKCDQCVNGTTRLSADNEDGCSPCDCNTDGSLSSVCDMTTSACRCKPGVGGTACDECMDGFFGFSEDGCEPCTCNPNGSQSDVCDKDTGECMCLPSVEGRLCDTCSGGFYNVSAGCIECDCDTDGTVNGSSSCDQESGRCPCKANVEGRTCDTCRRGFTALMAANEAGCEACNCSGFGTDRSGFVCDPVTSQCECLPSTTGHHCDYCVSGFYSTDEGCMECDCDLDGSSGSICAVETGECPCNVGVGGERCDFCLSGFFQFPRCEVCDCDVRGTEEGAECDVNTGECNCKMFVTGDTCNSCQTGYQLLDAANPFGCSAAPDEQGPPTASLRGSTYIELSWQLPESPNGVILGYRLYRNGSSIANVTERSYNDTNLTPNAYYSYVLESYNVISSTTSTKAVLRTLEGVPTGLSAPMYDVFNSTAVRVSWEEPTVSHGTVSTYVLVMETDSGNVEVFEGDAFSYIVTDLRPYTVYSFFIQACTTGGCGSSNSSRVETAQAPPTFQPAPNVSALSDTELQVQWSPPTEPNGVLLEYRVYQRDTPFEGDGFLVASVDANTLLLVVDDLDPFTSYQYRVESHTEPGGTFSEWSQGRTQEAAPSGVDRPTVVVLSSSSLEVSWTEPANPNGVIVIYSLYSSTPDSDVDVLLTNSSLPGSSVVAGLEPFTEYGFIVVACTSAGCNQSEVGSGFTGENAPTGQPGPTLTNITASSVHLSWESPSQPNGIISEYTVQRRTPSLLPSPAHNEVGVSFTGTGYATFTPANPSKFENELSLRFRTLDCCGILFYSINTAQTDMLAVELRQGIPWLIFDAGSGPGAIRPEGNTTFNDGAWHTLTVAQSGSTATITVDDTHTGSGQLLGTNMVIAYVVHYVGGLLSDTALQTLNANLNPEAILHGQSFAGCLFNFVFNDEVFDFSSGFPGVSTPDHGCPVDLVKTAQMLGGGYFSLAEDTLTGNRFNISFQFRTTHSDGLLIFVSDGSGGVAYGIELQSSSLHFVQNRIATTLATADRPCNREWHSITISQDEQALSVTVDDMLVLFTLNESTADSFNIFFGGVPHDSIESAVASDAGLDTDTPFSGCLRLPEPFVYVAGQSVTATVAESELVNFDGCGTAPGTSCVPPWQEIDTGTERSITDTGLRPFSAYLYRIVAMNTAGSAYSSWKATNTDESVPAEIGIVTLLQATSTSLTLTWNSPETPNGLITQYSVQATPETPVDGHTGENFTLAVTEPEQTLQASLDNLLPFTTYSVSLSASTAAGTGYGEVTSLTTREAAPEGVQPAYVTELRSRSLTLSWDPPTQPNGVITEYRLYVNDILEYSGLATTTTVGGLSPSTVYTFLIEACTSVGCSNSSETSNTTLPDKPDDLAPPSVVPLTPTSLRVTWEEPGISNGEIISYELQQITDKGNVTLFEGIDFSYRVANLVPNTLYRFRVLATNAGGTTASEVAENSTLEDAPDGLSPPVTTVLNATAVRISWEEPLQPNGVISEYLLFRNDSQVFRGLAMTYLDSYLEPFTFYSYYFQACTAGNCSASTLTVARTDEAIPEGLVALTITSITSNTFSLTINEVMKPNGIILYVVTLTGIFAESPVEETREVFNDTEVGMTVVGGLQPFSDYQITQTVSNGAGSLTGDLRTVMTAPAAPEGLAPPDLTLLNATTLYVSWSAPDQPNDNITRYELTIANSSGSPLILDQGPNTSTVISNLRPFTNYSVTLTAYNSVGSTSAVADIQTGEKAPTGFDEVVVEARGPRSILLSWDEPAQPNGVLVTYTVLEGGDEVASVEPPSVEYNVTGLVPYAEYQFSVLACTSAGCEESTPVTTRTLEDVPEGVQPPDVSNRITGQVLVTWEEPTHPNGIILFYLVERRQNSNEEYTQLHNQTTSLLLLFADSTVEPFTEYSYRIVAVNSAGSTTGAPNTILTPEAAPEGVLAPVLTSFSSSTVQVAFQPPLTPNGLITSYSLTRDTSDSTPTYINLNITELLDFNGNFIYVDMFLSPFTNYTYYLTVCTSAGCSDSDTVWAVTDEAPPAGLEAAIATTLNESSILVSWEAPLQPNGEIESYVILQRSLGFQLVDVSASLSNCCKDYLNSSESILGDGCNRVAIVDEITLSYTVTGLRAYTNYQYCIIATNSAGSTFSLFSNASQTSAAQMPTAGPILTASTVNSTAVHLSWSSLNISQLLGPFRGYSLYVREIGQELPGLELFSGDDQEFTATDLLASTEYTFLVSVSNGRGSAFSNNATAVTEEGIPANLSAPQVEALSATSIYVSWSAPNEPNGKIISYTIFLNSVEYYNQTLPGDLVIDNLSPFTLYTLRVEACTQFGCTLSPQVTVRTLESAPVGLASSTVQVTGPTSANVSWVAPNEPNGIVTNYQLYQREGGLNGEPILVLSGLAFAYEATNLRPFTTYGYEVYAINGGGNVSSGVTVSTTDEDRPTFLNAPKVTVISSTTIRLRWTAPAEINGVFLGYNVYRNGTELLSDVFFTEYDNINLEPFTEYSYTIEACTNAGCTSSATVSNTTLEAVPDMVSQPYFLNVQARSLIVAWNEPGQRNGIITQYTLYQVIDGENSTVLSNDLTMSYSLTELTPFTTYSFYVDTCNSAGCTSSVTVSVTTRQAPPEGVAAPTLRDLTSNSTHIAWVSPTAPNGIITNYTIQRGTETTDPVVLFEGLAFSYDDMGLIPNTLYSYTVTATNEGGSTESAPSYIQTIQDLAGGIVTPSVQVLGPTTIRVTWAPPEFPNGDISLYILYMDDVAVFSGIGFEYTRSDLTPYTEYTFYYRVRNQAGLASSSTVTNRTEPAPPEGLAPPSLDVLGSSAIRVEWQPPSAPNGEISEYRVRRRLFDSPPTEFIHFVTRDTTVLVFQNSGLEPFTRYQYRVEVFNQAGSTLSDFSDATTSEDIPEGVIAPSISSSDTFARNLTATWLAPLEPNGILAGYRLEYRLLLDPTTSLPGEVIVAKQTPANVMRATAVNLSPVTTYEFRVAAFNGAGDGFSEWEVVTTAEDFPEGITEIVVESRTSSSLTLSWGLPERPNGEIREYILLLDGEIEHQTQLTTYQVTRLEPFTTYVLQLGACTSAGCTYGFAQSVGTEEAPPTGQAAPTLVALGPRRVQVSWQPPSQANGIINLYQVLRQQDDAFPVVVLSTSDTEIQEFEDSAVLPATSYGYAIAANNSAGGVVSEYRALTTPEAAPEGVIPPVARVISSAAIDVSWNTPLQPNGIISQYQVFREGGGDLNESVYIGQNRQFTDTNLSPFTLYTYTLQACTSGGCAFSDSASNQTFEALPEGFNGTSIETFPLTATSIRVSWTEPLLPNGIILRYEIAVTDGTNLVEIVITDLETDVTNLQPYTEYTVTVDACNSVGCITGTTTVTTLESVPQFVAQPTLIALSPTAVSVQWQPPAQPNGEIILYILRRDGLAVFEGDSLNYTDTGLLPNRGYSYTVQAFTSVGGSEQSTSSSIQTPPDTPEDISPPTTTVLGADRIIVEWEVPGQPNGVIESYILRVNGSVVFEGTSLFEFSVDGLAPFTVYQFRLDVCTTTCGNSSSITERTGEATPTGLAPPTLLALFQNTTVLVTWEPPTKPNGIIIRYDLRRRLESVTSYNLVYSGPDLEFQDNGLDLQPAMVYQYQVTAANSVGSVTSDSNSVTLPDAAPEEVQRPTVDEITPNSLIVVAHPPTTPNGQLTSYILYQNDSNILAKIPTTQNSTIAFSVSGLRPFTVYVYRVEVCTVGGCGSSDEVTVTTAEDVPRVYTTPPVHTALSARSILVTWSQPSQPNGIIVSYTLWYRLACPQPEQPEFTSSTQCLEGPLIRITSTDQTQFTVTGSSVTGPFPYSRYQFLVEARNSVGAVNSTISLAVETDTSFPEVKNGVEFVANQTTGVVNLNWGSTFRPNGPILRYTLKRNGIALLSRPTTSVVLSNEPRDTDLKYVVTIQTSVGEASTDPITLKLQDITTIPSDTPSDATDDSSDEGSQFYKEAAFITGMVILGVCLLFIAGAVFLCFVRPRGDPGFPASPRSISTRLDTPTKLSDIPMRRLDTSTKRGHDLTGYSRGTVAGSWTPGDPVWEDLPDIGEEDDMMVTPRKHRSYSPRREEKARLIEEEVLPDTHIAGYASGSLMRQSPHYTTTAKEDFGTFRASQTTFADTKV